MDFEIDILIEDQRWSDKLHSLDGLASRAIHAAFTHLANDNCPAINFSEVSLAFVDDEKIGALNKNFRNKDKPTNVLSFPGTQIDGFRPLLGDIVLAYETIVKEAEERRISINDHVSHLVIHGFLHLNGFDHMDEKEAVEMERLEIDILKGLGIADPYDKDELS